MINTVKTSFFLLVALVLSACTDSRKLATIHQAEMLMQEQPDSALRMLQTIDRRSLHGESLARYALVYSIAQDKSGLDVTNDSLLRIAYEYYSQHPGDSLYARSQYYMGLYLCLTAQTDSAYSCLLKAKTASEEEKDYYTAYLATDRLRRIAEVSDTAWCLSLSKEAYRLYQKQCANNPVNEVYLLIGIGDGYYRCNNPDSAIHYYILALDKARVTGDSIAISSVYQNLSRYLLFDKQPEIALDYAKQAYNYRGYLDRNLAILFVQCYIKNGKYDTARQYIDALPAEESKENKIIRISLQHALSVETGEADAAQDYYDSACNVAADMYLSTLKEKLELHDQIMHEELERQRAESRGRVFALCFCFAIVLLVLIVWLFLKYHRAKKVEKELFCAEKARLLAEETMLRKEKEHKEQIMERTRFYVKNMVSILQEVEQYRIRQKKQKEKDKQDISKSKDERKEETRLKLKLDDKAWAEIQVYLEACEGSFVTRFKEQYPDISNSDFQLCMLLRCGFSNPELEQVYSIAAQSVKTRQLFLKDKLGVVDKTTSLRQYIKQF